MNLHIPTITPDQGSLDAAYAYAEAGWYVLPVDPGTKHPGSIVGKGWPAKSSRDPQQIADWWLLDEPALALHVGRSGAVAFDVDDPARLPAVLIEALGTVPAPHQSTRTTTPGRGHYLYAMPPGRMLGNSAAGLGDGAWGEVRGKNGIIVVAPSPHAKADRGGRYAWVRTGTLPPLPDALGALLRDAGESSDAVTDAEVQAFLDAHTGASRPGLLRALLGRWRPGIAEGKSRHNFMLVLCANAMKEAQAGYYPAREVASALALEFVDALSHDRAGSDRTLTPAQARAEFGGILAWAIGQARTAPQEALDAFLAGVEERAPEHHNALAELLPPPTPSTETGAADGIQDEAAQDPEGVPAPITDMLTDEAELRRLAHRRAVAEEVAKLEVRQEAQRILRERAQPAETPPITGLDAFLAIEDPPQRYRVEGLWPLGGRVMLAAQFKAGKTTMTGNLLRSLVDGTPFLDTFDVEPLAPGRRVVVIDDELDQRMIRSWLRDQDITHTEAAAVLALRGNLTSFDILTPTIRTRWAQALKEAGAEIVILDCLAPLVDALGLSEDKEAGQLLVALDELLGEAGVSEALVVHHMGHSGERTRGASRLRDWPDVEWRLVREKSKDGEVDPAAPRYFSAYGRDVDIKESALQFEPLMRRLTLSGGNRAGAALRDTKDAIVEMLTLSPGQSGRTILKELGEEFTQREVRDALKAAVDEGAVVAYPGARRATLHRVAERVAPPPDEIGTNTVSAGQSQCISALPDIGLKEGRTNSVRQGSDALKPQVTEPVHQCVASDSTQSGASDSVRPPIGGDATESLTRPDPPDGDATQASTPRPRLIDGRIIDPVGGRILQRHGEDLIDPDTGEVCGKASDVIGGA